MNIQTTFRKFYQTQGFVYNSEFEMRKKRGRQTEGYLRLEEVNFQKFREGRCASRSETLKWQTEWESPKFIFQLHDHKFYGKAKSENLKRHQNGSSVFQRSYLASPSFIMTLRSSCLCPSSLPAFCLSPSFQVLSASFNNSAFCSAQRNLKKKEIKGKKTTSNAQEKRLMRSHLQNY